MPRAVQACAVFLGRNPATWVQVHLLQLAAQRDKSEALRAAERAKSEALQAAERAKSEALWKLVTATEELKRSEVQRSDYSVKLLQLQGKLDLRGLIGESCVGLGYAEGSPDPLQPHSYLCVAQSSVWRRLWR